MTSLVKDFLGAKATSPAKGETTAAGALPATWYTSPEMYELERRAIFSKKWLLTTHKLRLPESGDWLRYEVAGFEFVVCKDRTGSINAFHNVCRHRAFPIVTEEKGHNSVLSCKYHGWSYGLNGKLAKAPGYQDLEGFDKAQNSLLPIHVHVDGNGFIWVNMDGGVKPEIAWSDDFNGLNQQKRFAAYDFDDYDFDHTWEMEGEYDWKILADNHNECYQYKTSQSTPMMAEPSSTPEQIERDFLDSSTYYFPNASMNVTPHLFFLQRFVPSSSGKSIMKYEVYRNKNASDDDFKVTNDIYKRILTEEESIFASAQNNLIDGAFVNGQNGPLLFQNSVRDLIEAHYKREQEANREIWPARQVLPEDATSTEKDIGLCSNVDCCRIKKAEMAF
ncbi:hypothetical protein G7Z17_g10227 [Cylindrodendrum hubeiense]|uniref:Rieske domain-containing protein n=1 Tax=Cylindrodendrum hubeiense TaxID=595255 RepID=A0A9P5H587_9HYPO|nr:hypothetical protein G7Z17_g10227 [Cylindrodendrum hubeiense]